MQIRFTKMQGAGNDYIYINGFEYELENPEKLAVQWSNRHFGIGADGLVLILPSATCDFRMRMFNADGSESEMCGNATRCIAKYVYDKGLTTKTTVTLETLGGVKVLNMNVEEGEVKRVTVDMGAPTLTPAKIPVAIQGKEAINYPIEVGGVPMKITCVSMGNPHAIVFVENLSEVDVHGLGRKLEVHPLFPKKTNVEFAEVLDSKNIKMRVWERGSGETLACGTGACATAVAAVLTNQTERNVTLQLLGGHLHIEWDHLTNHVFMTGPAEISYEGVITL